MPSLYPKIPHLPGSRTGPSDSHVGHARARAFTEEARDGVTVVVEEKLDGSCVVVRREGTAVIAYGRDGKPARLSRNLGRRLFALWVDENAARFAALLGDGEHAAGEWLAIAHGTIYALPHEPFVLFDIVANGARSGRTMLAAKAKSQGFTVPCILHTGAATATADALRALGEHGHHGADRAEGVVYRQERRGLSESVAKLVRHDKVDGKYLADHTGEAHVLNTWPGSEAWLSDARARTPDEP